MTHQTMCLFRINQQHNLQHIKETDHNLSASRATSTFLLSAATNTTYAVIYHTLYSIIMVGTFSFPFFPFPTPPPLTDSRSALGYHPTPSNALRNTTSFFLPSLLRIPPHPSPYTPPTLLKVCVHYFLSNFYFFSKRKPFKHCEKFHIKKLFSFTRYSGFCDFLPSFPHFPDSKAQKEVE